MGKRQSRLSSLGTFDEEQVFLSFGVITDIQYADIDDRGDRHYRNSLNVAVNAVRWWQSGSNGPVPAFVANLGDIIDDRGQIKPYSSQRNLQKVGDILSGISGDLLCLVGNHELMNFSREELRRWHRQKCRFVNDDGFFFYRYEPRVRNGCAWRFLVLDAFDWSVMTRGRGQSEDAQAWNVLRSKNTNGIQRPEDRRWTDQNGGLSKQQLDWFTAELRDASERGIRVGVFSHVSAHERAGGGGELLIWNYESLLQAMHDPEIGRCVQFFFSGHRHSGGFCTDEHGIHHCCFESPLHPLPGEPGTFARVDITEMALLVSGFAPPKSDYQMHGDFDRVLEDGEAPHSLRTRVLPLRDHSSTLQPLTD